MKGKKLTPQGTACIYFETDLKEPFAFDESKLTSVQAQVFSQLSSAEQEKIRKGCGVVIVDLENEKRTCSFIAFKLNYFP